MKISKIYCAYFSPGDTTKKVVTGIARSFKDYPVEEINLTDYDVRQNHFRFTENQLLIIGAHLTADGFQRRWQTSLVGSKESTLRWFW